MQGARAAAKRKAEGVTPIIQIVCRHESRRRPADASSFDVLACIEPYLRRHSISETVVPSITLKLGRVDDRMIRAPWTAKSGFLRSWRRKADLCLCHWGMSVATLRTILEAHLPVIRKDSGPHIC
jgi:hypothetical protein